jgi:hypothetical protein
MLTFKIDTAGNATLIDSTRGVNRNALRSFEDAEALAFAAGEDDFLAVDRGGFVFPRFDVIRRPKVGAPVSYAFNGDYYPCGYIKSVSASGKVITTTEGERFYRTAENSGCWKLRKTWSLVLGHHKKQNPEF